MATKLEILSEYIRDEMGFDGIVDPETDLLDAGILDSFTIVQAAVFIQEEFDIELEADDLVRENLSSLANMVALIDKQRSANDV